MLDRDPKGTTDLSIIRAVYTEEHEAASRALMSALAGGDNSAFMRPCRPIAGLDRHRDAAQSWLEGLGVSAEPDRILITNGAAHGIFLAVAAAVRPGDMVLTANLTDHGIIGLSNVLGFTLRGLPTDQEGVLPEAFEAACRAGEVTALVLIPSLNNPTSHVMGAVRRRAIADIARRHRVYRDRGRGLQAAARRATALDHRHDPGLRLLRHELHQVGDDGTAGRLSGGAAAIFDPRRRASCASRAGAPPMWWPRWRRAGSRTGPPRGLSMCSDARCGPARRSWPRSWVRFWPQPIRCRSARCWECRRAGPRRGWSGPWPRRASL